MPRPTPSGRALYSQTLLEHGRHPRNRGALPCPPAVCAEARVRLCGDRLTLYLQIVEARVTRATFEGQGCAISQAAASLLTEALVGRELRALPRLSATLRALIGGADLYDEPREALGPLIALAAISPHPARHACALLALDALDAATARAEDAIGRDALAEP